MVSPSDPVELERLRIGHEIHDAVLPFIFASSAGITRLLEDAKGRLEQDDLDQLHQVAQWLDEAMQTGRRLLTEIYPPALDSTTWDRAAADTLARLYQTLPTIKWDVADTDDGQTSPVALASYRITVEACRNAIRHGRAKNISVFFHRGSDRDYLLTITDDGEGFDPTLDREGHFGIAAMKSRAEVMGGDLAIESTPGGPTTVRVKLPCD
ncbi:Sensor histidine kinase LiaS [Rubripirellula amarantea]|uniref:histidine kinase n=1 Tax=Rubripirellula amarantea TaxID=2527999 RepID=A0A5C5WPB0_9BACT|nr:ATP-binding protein [Rubripirellula amarantea]TWT52407.1 Sensor histidine kinase LiaS [Rubripirellula amarantea]